MSYEDNLLINPSAETGDTTGWDVIDVTVVGGTTPETDLGVKIGESHEIYLNKWMNAYRVRLTFSGADGTNYFLLASDASMEQAVSSGDIGDLPDIDFKVTVDFKLTTAQNLWDASVKGKVQMEILYSDETKDIFTIPCVVGISYEGRDLVNSWLQAIANCDIRNDLGITSITITATTASLTDGLKIDKIELQKNLETDEGIDTSTDNEDQVLTADENGKPTWSNVPLTFIFTIEGDLSVAVNPCPALPTPRNCTVDKVYAYVKTKIGGPGSEFITIDILKNGTTMFPANPSGYSKARIPYNSNTGESDTPYEPDISKNDIITMNVDEIGNTSPGSDLTVEVRCK